jgi:hypothetical protein
MSMARLRLLAGLGFDTLDLKKTKALLQRLAG